MSNPFLDASQVVATSLGVTQEVAGIILGTILTVVLMLLIVWAMGRHGSKFLVPMSMMGAVMSWAIGWYPIWILIIAVVIILFAVFAPFSERISGGGDGF